MSSVQLRQSKEVVDRVHWPSRAFPNHSVRMRDTFTAQGREVLWHADPGDLFASIVVSQARLPRGQLSYAASPSERPLLRCSSARKSEPLRRGSDAPTVDRRAWDQGRCGVMYPVEKLERRFSAFQELALPSGVEATAFTKNSEGVGDATRSSNPNS